MSATSLAPVPFRAGRALVRASAPSLPGWVGRLVGPRALPAGPCVPTVRESAVAATPFKVETAVIPGALGLTDQELKEAVCSAYEEIQHLLRGSGAPYPVRFWNFIPRIHEPLGEGTRYMVFNAGRFAALSGSCSVNGGVGDCPPFPTASGVGYDGDDLVIHCLGAARPGEPIENPRQTPAYRYSARYGARPPCFTRATSLAIEPSGPRALLIAGTASVVGEDSRHPHSLRGQIAETFENLSALVAAWLEKTPRGAAESRAGEFENVRIYYSRESDLDVIVDAIADRLPRAGAVEAVRADICRPELLMEIECTVGMSALVPDPAGPRS